jgi:hypothetical protein
MRAALALVAVLLATPANAQNYGATPTVSAQRAGDGGRASASMDVRAPPSAVWAILSDCGQARRFMRDLVSCRVLDRGEGWDIREHRVRGFPLGPIMRNVSRITLEPNRRLAFRRVEGDWTRSEGEFGRRMAVNPDRRRARHARRVSDRRRVPRPDPRRHFPIASRLQRPQHTGRPSPRSRTRRGALGGRELTNSTCPARVFALSQACFVHHA